MRLAQPLSFGFCPLSFMARWDLRALRPAPPKAARPEGSPHPAARPTLRPAQRARPTQRPATPNAARPEGSPNSGHACPKSKVLYLCLLSSVLCPFCPKCPVSGCGIVVKGLFRGCGIAKEMVYLPRLTEKKDAQKKSVARIGGLSQGRR